jgi:hypothetical protein
MSKANKIKKGLTAVDIAALVNDLRERLVGLRYDFNFKKTII